MFESDSMPEASDGRERTANPLDDVSGSDDSGSATPERTASNRMQKSEMSKHAALMAPAGRTLDLAERKWLQDKWFALDTSGDGILQFDETKILLRDLKKKMTDGEIKRAFEDMDTDGCGSVDFDEFYVWFAHQDAEQFAHLMARGAHRKLVQGIAAIGLGMFVPCVIIILVSGPDPRVSIQRLPTSPQSSALHMISERVLKW